MKLLSDDIAAYGDSVFLVKKNGHVIGVFPSKGEADTAAAKQGGNTFEYARPALHRLGEEVETMSVKEYAMARGISEQTVYVAVREFRLDAIHRGRFIRIPVRARIQRPPSEAKFLTMEGK